MGKENARATGRKQQDYKDIFPSPVALEWPHINLHLVTLSSARTRRIKGHPVRRQCCSGDPRHNGNETNTASWPKHIKPILGVSSKSPVLNPKLALMFESEADPLSAAGPKLLPFLPWIFHRIASGRCSLCRNLLARTLSGTACHTEFRDWQTPSRPERQNSRKHQLKAAICSFRNACLENRHMLKRVAVTKLQR